MDVSLTYDILVERIYKWAMGQDDIRLMMIIGSRARTDTPADEFSDLDLLILTIEPMRYISASDWLREIGTYYLTFLEETAVGGFVERRVLFESGLDVDFIPLPPEVFRNQMPAEAISVFRRGYRVLLDKDGLAHALGNTLRTRSGEDEMQFTPPSQQDFLQVVNDFLYHSVWTAKKLCRGELWTAKMCCDGHMKDRLLQMIIWHRRATATEPVDTWHSGRFLDSWGDPQVLSELGRTFALYEATSVWQALRAMVDLFGRLGKDVSGRLGYTYPHAGDTYVKDLLQHYESLGSGGAGMGLRT